MLVIRKNQNRQISANFQEKEFRSGSSNAPEEFYMPSELPQLLQDLRTFYNVGILINSTGRTVSHNNSLVGASKTSQHLFRYNGSFTPISGQVPTVNAIDFHFEGWDVKGSAGQRAHDDFYNRMTQDNWLDFPPLKNNNINSIGLYNSFFHVDYRPLKSNGQGYKWDNSTKKKSSLSSIQEALSGNDQDGVLGVEKQLKKGALTIITGLIIIGLIVGGVIYYKKTKK
jgi:hypothetical protein